MAPGAIVFALANPEPEVDPDGGREHAAVVATGRSDYPNQINNVLAFPGVFRGLLDAQSNHITPEMLVAAAEAIAATVGRQRAQPQLHRAQRVPPRPGEDGRRGGSWRRCGGRSRGGPRSPSGVIGQ